MDVILLIESSLCALYVTLTSPIVRIGNAWMGRMERISKPQSVITESMIARDPTVSDIRPAGSVVVRSMGEGGQWREHPDYPIRLLPKMPGVVISNGEGER